MKSSWKIETSTPLKHMGWIDTGSVPTRVGANGADDNSRSQWVFVSKRNEDRSQEETEFNVQRGDIQAPSELATEPYEGTCAG